MSHAERVTTVRAQTQRQNFPGLQQTVFRPSGSQQQRRPCRHLRADNAVDGKMQEIEVLERLSLDCQLGRGLSKQHGGRRVPDDLADGSAPRRSRTGGPADWRHPHRRRLAESSSQRALDGPAHRSTAACADRGRADRQGGPRWRSLGLAVSQDRQHGTRRHIGHDVRL